MIEEKPIFFRNTSHINITDALSKPGSKIKSSPTEPSTQTLSTERFDLKEEIVSSKASETVPLLKKATVPLQREETVPLSDETVEPKVLQTTFNSSTDQPAIVEPESLQTTFKSSTGDSAPPVECSPSRETKMIVLLWIEFVCLVVFIILFINQKIINCQLKKQQEKKEYYKNSNMISSVVQLEDEENEDEEPTEIGATQKLEKLECQKVSVPMFSSLESNDNSDLTEPFSAAYPDEDFASDSTESTLVRDRDDTSSTSYSTEVFAEVHQPLNGKRNTL